jgi:FAD/FMN-containing dehydrogenase
VARRDSKDARDRELFWAVRGGTGNQFGVLLEVVYQLVPLGDLWGFAVVWDPTKAAAALDTLQRDWMRGTKASKQLGYQLALASVGGQPSVAMLGMWNGTRASGKAVIDPLQTATGGVYKEDKVDSYLVLNEGLLDILDPPVPGLVELKRAGYLTTPLGQTGWQTVWDAYVKAPNKYGLALVEAYGGRIAEIPASDSAFVHRAVDGDFFVDSFFTVPGATELTSRGTAQQWLDSVMSAAAPGLSGAVYQNYPDRALTGYKEAYWPGVVARLEALKQKVDPDGLLDFEQTV